MIGWKNADELVGKKMKIETTDGIVRTSVISKVVTHAFNLDGQPTTLPVSIELDGDSVDIIEFHRLRSLTSLGGVKS